MNKTAAKKIALNITNDQLHEMLINAQNNIKDWKKSSIINKSLTKGSAWHILAENFDPSKNIIFIHKFNLIREFGEFLPENLKPIKKQKNKITLYHIEPTHIK